MLVGLLGLANKITECLVKAEFQMHNKYFMEHANKTIIVLFINSN